MLGTPLRQKPIPVGGGGNQGQGQGRVVVVDTVLAAPGGEVFTGGEEKLVMGTPL
jgi:hypothetical protein